MGVHGDDLCPLQAVVLGSPRLGTAQGKHVTAQFLRIAMQVVSGLDISFRITVNVAKSCQKRLPLMMRPLQKIQILLGSVRYFGLWLYSTSILLQSLYFTPYDCMEFCQRIVDRAFLMEESRLLHHNTARYDLLLSLK